MITPLEAQNLILQPLPVVRPRPRAVERPLYPGTSGTDLSLISSLFVTSISLHLLLIGLVGFGVPQTPAHGKVSVPPPTQAKLIEDVKIEAEPPIQPPPAAKKNDSIPPPQPVAANIDLPPLAKIEPIAAVPASVPVAFAIPVNGPARLVSDVANASGAAGGQAAATPVSLDDNSQGRDLLLPLLEYPSEALARHLSGTVVIEFRTSPTGEIYDARVRRGSGHAALDDAALENLRHGRWTGEAGYYLKAYQFSLR